MKTFWGYNNRQDAELDWSKSILESGIITEKLVDIIDDGSVWPQKSSKKKIVTRIELENDIISF